MILVFRFNTFFIIFWLFCLFFVPKVYMREREILVKVKESIKNKGVCQKSVYDIKYNERFARFVKIHVLQFFSFNTSVYFFLVQVCCLT